MKNYKESQYRDVYESIAKESDSTPEHVYMLAHGTHAVDHKDSEIIDKLAEYNIVNIQKKKRRKRHNDPKNVFLILFIIIAVVLVFTLLFFSYNTSDEKNSELRPENQSYEQVEE